MSDDVVHSNTPSLFTLTGQIAVHFMDGSEIEGNFATQDAFNIFLTVDNEPMMIPRAQIKFIKGKQGQQIETDTSQMDLKTEPVPVKGPGPDTRELFWDSEPAEEEEEEEDGTMVLFASDIGAESDDDEDEDGTVILFAGDQHPPAPVEPDDEDGTLVFEPETPIPTAWNIEDDDEDMTVVISDSDELPAIKDEDQTMVISDDAEMPEASGTFLCVSGPHAGEVFKLKSGIITIGRSSDNVIVLSNDKEISRHHAIVLHESGRFVVQDQNSLNGTFVNDEPVTAPHYLEDGDIVLVGLSTLRYQAE